MNLRILLPFGLFTEQKGVSRIVAETQDGSFGFLPNRLDCVGALVPGILVYETEEHGEAYVAVDEGIIVKTGADVLVSVRNAVTGTDLSTLEQVVERKFRELDARERDLRSVLDKVESGFIRQLRKLREE